MFSIECLVLHVQRRMYRIDLEVCTRPCIQYDTVWCVFLCIVSCCRVQYVYKYAQCSMSSTVCIVNYLWYGTVQYSMVRSLMCGCCRCSVLHAAYYIQCTMYWYSTVKCSVVRYSKTCQVWHMYYVVRGVKYDVACVVQSACRSVHSLA